MDKTTTLTVAQAVIAFLRNQHVERDGRTQPFFAGCFGIFGHGNVAGIGQALQQIARVPLLPVAQRAGDGPRGRGVRQDQQPPADAFACTSSIGPGATNMLTGAATATINRLPVLLLPGDIFARRNVAPVLQQLESEHSQDVSVNDCFRPGQPLLGPHQSARSAAYRAARGDARAGSPAETGAVTLALPQDVQAEAYAYPVALFRERVWHVPRNRPDRAALEQAAEWIRAARRPLIVAGGGVIYSEASDALRDLSSRPAFRSARRWPARAACVR